MPDALKKSGAVDNRRTRALCVCVCARACLRVRASTLLGACDGSHQSPPPKPTQNAARRCVCQAVLVTGGVAGAQTLRALVRTARREQHALCADIAPPRPAAAGSRRGSGKAVAVDATFARRLLRILRM